MYSIGKFAKMIGVSTNTLRNWEKSGKLVPLRTIGNQRRYSKAQLKTLIDEETYQNLTKAIK